MLKPPLLYIGSNISTTNTSVDTTPPVITRLGSSPVSVVVSTVYTDAGATALDDIDGDITANIVTVNPVDEDVVGTYTVTYNVSDTAGNAASQETRTVNVVARASSGSSGGGTYFGCKDPNATNYEYFAASKPSLCVYTTSTTTATPIAAVIAPVTYVAPLFPNSGFAPENKTMFLGLAALAGIVTVIISSFVILAKRSKV